MLDLFHELKSVDSRTYVVKHVIRDDLVVCAHALI